MTISGDIRRGDVVYVHGQRYVVRPNGTSVYLYDDTDALRESRHVRTMMIHVLRRDGRRISVNEVVVVRPRARRVIEEEIRYLYVVRNCDLPRSERELKIGITSSIMSTLRTYRRIVPNAQAIMVVDCEGAARPLERELQRVFSDFRVDHSEVFEVRPHEVRRALGRCKLAQHRDGIFRRSLEQLFHKDSDAK